MSLRMKFGAGAALGLMAAVTIGGGLVACGKVPGHDRNKLWELVGSRCAKDAEHHPCAVYDPQDGYALLKDLYGHGQYLLIPTKKVPGIEDASLLQPETPNYLAEAWAERQRVPAGYGFPVPDEHLSLAINSRDGRTQDQLHIHIDCLTPYVRAEIDKNMIGEAWTPVSLYGHPYRARLVQTLDPSPFRLVGDAGDMADHTIVVTPGHHGGFVILDDVAHALDRASGEEVQDHKCKIDDPKHQAMHMDGMEPGMHMNGMM